MLISFSARNASMASEVSKNESIAEKIKQGTARFELTSTPVPSIASQITKTTFLPATPHCFFARISSSLGRESSAVLRKLERYSIHRVTGDGRCMFRALVKGMALNKGIGLRPREEREEADNLRMAVKEVICDNGEERKQYEEALIAITIDESLKRYCQRIARPDFWGGESELLVLSKLFKQPIIVYIPEHEHTRGGWGSGFIPIAEYGADFRKDSTKGKPRKVVRLLYSGRNHYDLLV